MTAITCIEDLRLLAKTRVPGVELPCLKLRGGWLREAGFAIGQKLKVEVNEGRLVIGPVD